MQNSINKVQQSAYLSNLKVFLTILVIFHHAGQAYGSGGGWAYQPSNPEEFVPWLWRFFSVNAAYFMGLFFFISGYFVPHSFDKYGLGRFIQKKIVRLGLPIFIIGSLLSLGSHKIELGHLWYLENLLFFCIIYALVRKISKKTLVEKEVHPSIKLLVFIALGLAIVDVPVRLLSPQDSWIWLFYFLRMEPAHFPQYLLMFTLGIISYRQNWLKNISSRTGLFCIFAAVVMACLIYFSPEKSFAIKKIYSVWAVYESFLCIFFSFGLLYLFQKRFDSSNIFLGWMASQSYGVYVFHLLLIIVIQNIFDKLVIGSGGLGKFLFIGITSVIVSYGFTWMLRGVAKGFVFCGKGILKTIGKVKTIQ